ncbi:hypothetical protein AA12717_0923 [Gluconacetobacter sacchari DSM 12717]|uniref:Uncharacterized protein n=2 Tax=Gluconacetobacter sacchari TaxID=92759 RepID=A0A7W4IF06_9PROT|nr:hypothetical protein [Gluconacetobacter sacchari]MBB2161569.1 hypothetical protein [Gluconacetobacter sacchari]GBQ21559.1 hypothetical protein AA12717_0923 [Gluconacetobacter sacchari DSM 12717]
MIMKNAQPAAPPERARLIWREGRGRNGGSTSEIALVNEALKAGRKNIRIADGDIQNDTMRRQLSRYPDLVLPPPKSGDLDDFKKWVSVAIADCAERGSTTIMDLGGNDTMPRRLAEDLDLVTGLKEANIDLVVHAFCGTSYDDIENVYRAWKNGPFCDVTNRVLFLNGGVGDRFRIPTAIMEFFVSDRRVQEMGSEGVKLIPVPFLACLGDLERADMSIHDALEGKKPKSGDTPSIFWPTMARQWRDAFMAGVLDSARPDLFP